jgi:hypothetical protein
VVFDGDNVDQVIEIFADKHQLTEEKKQKLGKVVQNQLRQILPRIEEDEEPSYDELNSHHADQPMMAGGMSNAPSPTDLGQAAPEVCLPLNSSADD